MILFFPPDATKVALESVILAVAIAGFQTYKIQSVLKQREM